MAELEQFSLEKHLADWSQHQQSVTVEGTLQEDGDFYVIGREPHPSSSLLRVRKADVSGTEKSRTVPAAGGERQLYHVSIKRGVPLQFISVIKSDELLASPHLSQLTQASPGWYFWVCYENGSSYWSQQYVIEDQCRAAWQLAGSAPNFKSGYPPTYYADYPPNLGYAPTCP